MFYSHQLPARKALLGQICEEILNPAAPMALRLSGILMGGFEIVYERKVKLIFDDVTRLAPPFSPPKSYSHTWISHTSLSPQAQQQMIGIGSGFGRRSLVFKAQQQMIGIGSGFGRRSLVFKAHIYLQAQQQMMGFKTHADGFGRKPVAFKEIEQMTELYAKEEFQDSIPRSYEGLEIRDGLRRQIRDGLRRVIIKTGWEDKGLERKVDLFCQFEDSLDSLVYTGNRFFLVNACFYVEPSAYSELSSRMVKSIHAMSFKFGLSNEAEWRSVQLLKMYGDGHAVSLDYAEKIFKQSKCKGVAICNAMLVIYSGQAPEKIEYLFKEMMKQGIAHNDETFRALISGLGHYGQPELARDYLYTMEKKYGLKPKRSHYVALVDAFARSRDSDYLKEAVQIVKDVPIAATHVAFNSILSRCVPNPGPTEEEIPKIKKDISIAKDLVNYLHQKNFRYAVLVKTHQRLKKLGLVWPDSVSQK